MKAKIRNKVTGETIPVTSTTEHPACSYGQAVWVDTQGTAYFQVGMANPMYEEVSVEVEDRNTLGQYIRGVRVSQGISIRKMAEMANIRPSTVQNVEKGSFTPRLDIVQKMLSALNKRLNIS
jgi:DNA-binding XRE family transcriptional regulator